MERKRILLFSLFFFILVGSLLYYSLPRVLYPLRIDSIPPGAYLVPWMRPNPSIDVLKIYSIDSPPWDVDTVMAGALRLNVTFQISMPNETRIIPSTVYLGHDLDYLYVGGKFHGMYRNPASNPSNDPDLVLPNYFDILFDVANDGVLAFPESGSDLAVAIFKEASWHAGTVWAYHDKVWRNYIPEIQRGAWDLAENVGMNNSTQGLSNPEYDNSTGTLTIIFSRHLRKSGYYDTNALQMRHGERWVMGFILELGYATWYGLYSDFVDGWPRKAYPYLDNDASWWPKLVIDLSNPPAEFST